MAFETNNITIIGRLTRDIEFKNTQSGHDIATTAIANTPGAQDKGTLYINITIWGQKAQNAQQYLKKGDEVCVTGQLTMQTWQDQAGNNRTSYQINVQSLQYLRKAQQNVNQGQQAQQNPPQYQGGGYEQQQQSYQGNSQSQQAANQPQQSYGGQDDYPF